MATSKEYAEFVLEQCPGLSIRAMMGEYVLYYCGKVVGGIYDNTVLVKPTPSAKVLIPEGEYQLPYPGSKTMMLAVDPEDRALMQTLFEAMYEELPESKSKKKKTDR